ncbi:hypothetical protein [Shewanella woodyi]|uniref:hypothetical protein n=1 Tax=Shewanella woodyi TaxID=60961 RepID=UPI003749EA42
MNHLGISPQTDDVYEGSRSHGVRVDAPFLLPYQFVGKGFDKSDFTDQLYRTGSHIFREDFFDPITRIKRGRFYHVEGEADWYLQDNKRSDLERVECRSGYALRDRLITYQRSPLVELRKPAPYPDVILGREPFISIWKIISIETSITGTPIVTLKSHRSFGETPELITDQVPDSVLTALKTAIEKLENSINRLGPTDVVDRCRDVLSVVFGERCSNREKDLGKAIVGYVALQDKKHDNLISWAAHIVNRLHPRGKPNEQFRHGFREPSEEDAQLAVRCVWIALVELGWGRSS